MKRLILLGLFFWVCVWALPVCAEAKAPIACDVLSEKDAVAMVGGPLGEVFKTEELPTMENGHDHNSVCGFFPKGYKIEEADRPPERGLQTTLHAMRTNAEAKTFYEHTLSMHQDMTRQPGSPFEGDKITPLTGMGNAAFLLESKSEPEPGSSYEIATITFVKGDVMGQVTVWKKAAPVVEIAKSAVKKVLAKLP
jgi:hypothetical protein